MAACLTQIASDIYTPSLPAIATHLAASIVLVQWSVAIYLLGVALSQLVYGPLSDGIGRKPPLIIGLLIMLIGSVVCSFTSNIYILIAGRLFKAVGLAPLPHYGDRFLGMFSQVKNLLNTVLIL